MYVTFRRYKVEPANVAEILRLVNEGFVPIISKSIGFVSYVIFCDEEKHICSVSTFTTRAGMLDANDTAAEWVEKNIARLLPSPAIVSQGESLLTHGSKLIMPTRF